jgi:hypothetical protein
MMQTPAVKTVEVQQAEKKASSMEEMLYIKR